MGLPGAYDELAVKPLGTHSTLELQRIADALGTHLTIPGGHTQVINLGEEQGVQVGPEDTLVVVKVATLRSISTKEHVETLLTKAKQHVCVQHGALHGQVVRFAVPGLTERTGDLELRMDDHKDNMWLLSKPLPFLGTTASIGGLGKRTDLNGLVGKIVSYRADKERFVIHLEQTGEPVLIKAENLNPVSDVDSQFRPN